MSEQAIAAARVVLERNHLALEPGESPLSALGWHMGDAISYERALTEIVEAALNASGRENAPPPAISAVCPTCNAQAGQQCTAPDDTGRHEVKRFHSAREDRAVSWT